MLLDARKMQAVEAPAHREWEPADYDTDQSVYVFTIGWVSEGEAPADGDIVSFQEAADFLARPGIDGEDELTLAEAQEILSHGGRVYVGPEDDLYLIAPLPEPMAEDRWGEVLPLDEINNGGFEEPFDCRSGVDYPATL